IRNAALDGLKAASGGLLDYTAYAKQLYSVDRLSDADAKDDGQFGIALRTYSDLFGGTEFGLYYMNIHSRLPYISGQIGTAGGIPGYLAGQIMANGCVPTSLAAGIPATLTVEDAVLVYNPSYQIAYPDDIHIAGASFATSLPNGASLSREISYK